MWAPRWLRTLARRKTDEEANAESAEGMAEFATGGLVSGSITPGSDEVPFSLREDGCHGWLIPIEHDSRDVAVDEIMGMLKPPTRAEVQGIIARVYAAGYANREEGSQ